MDLEYKNPTEGGHSPPFLLVRLFNLYKNMFTTPQIDKIIRIIAPSVTAMGYEIVRVTLQDGKKSKVLQIMVDRTDKATIAVEDCERISKTVSALLDVEDPISDAYTLEVSSPGIDRPLMKPADFIAHIGSEVKIETVVMLNGRKRFKGILSAADEKNANVQIDGETYEIPYSQVHSAKLVLTDALIRQYLAQHKQKTKQNS